jgi:hypothetical protein
MNFIKLKNLFPFNVNDIILRDELLSIGSGSLKNYSIDLDNPIIEQVYSVLPVFARNLFSLSFTKISTEIAPHVDDVKTSILFYINAGECKTQFYNIVNPNPNIYYSSTELNNEQIIDEDFYKPITYRMEDLHEDTFYIANDYEVYCINGSQPHAVISTNNIDKISRSFILLKTDLPFSTVKLMLEKTNSI